MVEATFESFMTRNGAPNRFIEHFKFAVLETFYENMEITVRISRISNKGLITENLRLNETIKPCSSCYIVLLYTKLVLKKKYRKPWSWRIVGEVFFKLAIKHQMQTCINIMATNNSTLF